MKNNVFVTPTLSYTIITYFQNPERETDGETDRETDRPIDRQTKRQTQRERSYRKGNCYEAGDGDRV